MAQREVKHAMVGGTPANSPVLRHFSELSGDEQLARVRQLFESTPPLKAVIERQENAWRRRGIKPDRQDSMRASLTRSHGAYLTLLTTAMSRLEAGGDFSEGQLRREVNKAAGLSLGGATVSNWLNKSTPKFMARQVSEGVAVIPSREDPDFAFFCCFTSAQRGSLPNHNLKVSNEDAGVVGVMRFEAKRLLGKTPTADDLKTALRPEGLYSFQLECPKVLDYLRKATDGEKGLAWGHLKSRDERIEGARGFLAANSSVVDRGREKAHPTVRMTKNFPPLPEGEEPRLFADMQILLARLGINSSLFEYRKRGMWILEICGLKSLLEVRRLRLLPDQKHRKLEMLFERRGDETLRPSAPADEEAKLKAIRRKERTLYGSVNNIPRGGVPKTKAVNE
ncbi:MAG: hypothetical protein PHG85_01555 [Candidatus Altiarchaeota archaeon]|nr:hypothetical protein [Candidatus Altiarchaeota archaeon]